ncbi:MAG: hypothetical protein ACLFV7_13015, partial [Phycisphaerae bacterium]
VPLAVAGKYIAGLGGIFAGVAVGNVLAGLAAWFRFRRVQDRLEKQHAQASGSVPGLLLDVEPAE